MAIYHEEKEYECEACGFTGFIHYNFEESMSLDSNWGYIICDECIKQVEDIDGQEN